MKKGLLIIVIFTVSIHAMEPGKKESETLEKQVAKAMDIAHKEEQGISTLESEEIPDTKKHTIWSFFATVKASASDKGSDLLSHLKLALQTKEMPIAQDDEKFYIDIGLLSEKNRDFILKFYFHLLAMERNQPNDANASQLLLEDLVSNDMQ